ncbi:LepB GTPase-activating domain-containing protein [Legionella antarctica]|nr:LepB GTPase-activating domain-containing protein [Legionella antarctica]
MNENQLATICLEEMNTPITSPLIIRILQNEMLWKKIETSFFSGVFNARMDNPLEKITKIVKWHQLLQNPNVKTANDIRILEEKERLLQNQDKAEEKNIKDTTQQGYQMGDISRHLFQKAQEAQANYHFGDITKGLLAMVNKKSSPSSQPSQELPPEKSYKIGDYTRSFFSSKKPAAPESPPSNDPILPQKNEKL